ncbi:MAG: transcriptional repressor LexA [Bacteroidota bacterium]
MEQLPPRQRRVLEILMEASEEGRMPTVREIAAKLGVRAPGTIQDHLKALEEKGFLARDPGKSRNLRLAFEPPRGLPILGKIAAGKPIEAIEDRETLAWEGLGFEGCFVLRVKGESMIEDHIQDGDLVVVRPQSTARNGDIVVAMLPGGDATLKRFYQEAERIRLQPANSTMEPIYVREVTIQGRVVAVVRQL